MSVRFVYGTRVAVLPHAVAAHIDKATKKDIRILLELAASPDAPVSAIAAAAGVKEAEVEASFAFWRGTGVLIAEEGESAPAVAPTTEAPAVKVVADKGLPAYSTEELSEVLSRRTELAQLVNDAQQAFGKVFNTHEIAIIAGLADYLGLDEEYILLLLTHCRNMEKKSLRYVEKMAITLHDEGVHNAEELEARLHSIEIMASAFGKVRALFGISSRALTTKEKTMIEKWICVMKYDEDMLRRAYEITVDSTTKPSIPYANSILERWYGEGYRTLADVDAALAEYKRKKAGDGSSFDADEWFEAALKRTYGE